MATLADVRKFAWTLPGTSEGVGRFGFSVEVKGKAKGILWSWAERFEPRKARVPNDAVLAVIVPNLTAKDLLIASDPEKYFTEPHYNGFPAVLVRLEAVTVEEIEDLILEAWRCKASKNLTAELESRRT